MNHSACAHPEQQVVCVALDDGVCWLSTRGGGPRAPRPLTKSLHLNPGLPVATPGLCSSTDELWMPSGELLFSCCSPACHKHTRKQAQGQVLRPEHPDGCTTLFQGTLAGRRGTEEKASNTQRRHGRRLFLIISQFPDSLATLVLIQIVAFIPICPRFVIETLTMLMLGGRLAMKDHWLKLLLGRKGEGPQQFLV